MIWAVILAAGESKRMGAPKLLLPYVSMSRGYCERAGRPQQSVNALKKKEIAAVLKSVRSDKWLFQHGVYGGRTIIETVIKRVSASRVDRTLVVLGSHWRTLKELIRKYSVDTAVNSHFKRGMLSSIQRGIAALPRKCRAAVIVLGDQPAIRSGLIDALIAAYRRTGNGIVVPVCGRKRGHPVLVDLKYRAEIAALDPEIGLRELLQRHPGEILEVRMPRSSVLLDIDTPADYRKALKIREKR